MIINENSFYINKRNIYIKINKKYAKEQIKRTLKKLEFLSSQNALFKKNIYFINLDARDTVFIRLNKINIYRCNIYLSNVVLKIDKKCNIKRCRLNKTTHSLFHDIFTTSDIKKSRSMLVKSQQHLLNHGNHFSYISGLTSNHYSLTNNNHIFNMLNSEQFDNDYIYNSKDIQIAIKKMTRSS